MFYGHFSEDSVAVVIRYVRSDAPAINHNSANYDMGEFIHRYAIKQTSTSQDGLRIDFGWQGYTKSLSLTQATEPAAETRKFRVDQAATRSGLHRVSLRGDTTPQISCIICE